MKDRATQGFGRGGTPSQELRLVLQVRVQSRSVGQSTSGSQRAMVVVAQRKRPGTGQLSVKGCCAQAAAWKGGAQRVGWRLAVLERGRVLEVPCQWGKGAQGIVVTL